MNLFGNTYTKLQSLYAACRKISIIDAAKPARVHRTMILEKILEKILLHDHSILLLLGPIPDHMEELDASLIASATRNIMESTNLYFHLSQRGLSPEEVEMRISIMLRNETQNEIDITKKLGISQNSFNTQIRQWYFKKSAEDFREDPQFAQLPANVQAQVLSGRKPAFRMGSPQILQPDIESAVYNLLSNSVHGLHLGLNSNSLNYTLAFRNFFSTEKLILISLQVSCIYTAHVVKDYLNLRKPLNSLLTPEEKALIKECLSTAELDGYLDQLRVQYEEPFFVLPQEA